jgi:hypothetical protein
LFAERIRKDQTALPGADDPRERRQVNKPQAGMKNHLIFETLRALSGVATAQEMFNTETNRWNIRANDYKRIRLMLASVKEKCPGNQQIQNILKDNFLDR